MRLDLACGETPAEGYDGVDVDPLPGVRYLCDLEIVPWTVRDLRSPEGARRPVILKEGSVDELFCSHFVEHVSDLVGFMNEAYRVLRPGGRFVIRHPYQFSLDAWQDPTHRRALNEVSWNYYSRKWREANRLSHYLGIETDFAYDECLPVPTEEYQDASPEAFQRAIRKFVNVCRELQVTLVKTSPDEEVDP